MQDPKLNLRNVVAVLADKDMFTRNLIAQMLRGFGLNSLLLATTGAEAKQMIFDNKPDLCFVEGELDDMTSAELIQSVRRKVGDPLRFIPIVVLSGYTQARLVSEARDGGAHLVIRKPVSPQTLFDRIRWVAGAQRPFIEASTYIGPDRRFRTMPPPDKKMKRDTDPATDIAPDTATETG